MCRLFLLLIIVVGFDLSVDAQSKGTYPNKADLASFNKHVSDSLRLPAEAEHADTTWLVSIAFAIDATGHIIKSSIKVIEGISPALDEEALRVVRSYTGFMRLQKAQHNISTPWQTAVTIRFQSSKELREVARNLLHRYIRTTIVKKPVKESQEEWDIFQYEGLINPIDKIMPGDTVAITGWGSLGYEIQNAEHSGFVSYKAIAPTKALDSLNQIIESASFLRGDKSFFVDTISSFKSPYVFITLTTDKDTIYVGECATVEFSLNIGFKNQLPIKFTNTLPEQIIEFNRTVKCASCFQVDGSIDDIVGQPRSIGTEQFVSYPLSRKSMCATKPGTITLPPANLTVLQVERFTMEPEHLLELNGRGLKIHVRDLPKGIIPFKEHNYVMTGDFTMDEDLPAAAKTGDPVLYTITLSGSGFLFPISPPTLKLDGTKIELAAIESSDTVTTDALMSERTFVYRITFLKPGNFDLQNKISFKYFDPSAKQLRLIKSGARIDVTGNVITTITHDKGRFERYNNFIALDVSRSMGITDYEPNRLETAKKAIKDFATKNSFCEVGLMIYSGRAYHWNARSADSCFSVKSINQIDLKYGSNGTAIGDAVWLAKNSFRKDASPKILVIIGDGENNFGSFTPAQAAQLAAQYNIRIYSIGIGRSGRFSLGRDVDGNDVLVDSMFSSNDLKTIATITGGKYYWAKDAVAITGILHEIFSTQKK